jgi:hypothetical protein
VGMTFLFCFVNTNIEVEINAMGSFLLIWYINDKDLFYNQL